MLLKNRPKDSLPNSRQIVRDYMLYEDVHRAVIDAGLKTHEVLTADPELIQFVEQSKLNPGCRILDVGCGCGRNAVFLAKRGFTITAIDVSPSAIKLIKRLAKESGVVIDTLVLDATRRGNFFQGSFNGVIDVRCLHNIINVQERKIFLSNLFQSLVSGGWYFGANIGRSDEKSVKKNVTTENEQFINIDSISYEPIILKTKSGNNKKYFVRVSSVAPMWSASYKRELAEAGFTGIQIKCSKGQKPLSGCLLATARKVA